MKIACCQYKVRDIDAIEEYEEHITSFVKQAAEGGARLILFPEFVAIELLTLDKTPAKNTMEMDKLCSDYGKKYTEYLHKFFSGLASEYNIAVAAGTHFTYYPEKALFHNSAGVYMPDGTVFFHNKVHRAYEMIYNMYQVTAGDEFCTFEFEGVKFGINTCYDNCFPESARIMDKLGAEIILSPTCCMDEYGKQMVCLSCRARAVENFLYVVNAQMVGLISFPYHIPYGITMSGISGIYGPNHAMLGDPDAIVAQAKDGREELLISDIDIDKLRWARKNKLAGVIVDQRPDVYRKYLY